MKTALVHHPLFLQHNTGEGHPENAKRYEVILAALQNDEKFWQRLVEFEAPTAPKGNILAVHTPQQFKKVETAAEEMRTHLDADTVISMRSFDVALRAAGGACRAVDAVLTGESQNAFVACRPPGHHATADSSMGFCLFNNVAVAARYAQQKYKDIKKIAIVDWDVHHGNGTQGIFFEDPTVFFFSIHQYPWYPGSGSWGETGRGRGKDFTYNVPIKAQTSATEHRRMFDKAINNIAGRFQPDLILISAGFDAHRSDPLGQLNLEDDDFAAMTRTVKEWAGKVCGGRVVSCLEGGYNLETLGETVKTHVSALMEN
jgi:acetoin utilization deacetylase AcuC-like enzyme